MIVAEGDGRRTPDPGAFARRARPAHTGGAANGCAPFAAPGPG
ncbi:hypothetical protein SLI_2277 [Streptomyces lividans 1326]|uniref:Uncharacterized protein n=1 Tax=Streptomyces lividans 1326 TaxID=1200984 RepID=A0A7U9DN11_STRLI|nr:hypothetical protein SLI_2277 [Streptomyces lividans 1326]